LDFPQFHFICRVLWVDEFSEIKVIFSILVPEKETGVRR
jgi:hypothetical protein